MSEFNFTCKSKSPLFFATASCLLKSSSCALRFPASIENLIAVSSFILCWNPFISSLIVLSWALSPPRSTLKSNSSSNKLFAIIKNGIKVNWYHNTQNYRKYIYWPPQKKLKKSSLLSIGFGFDVVVDAFGSSIFFISSIKRKNLWAGIFIVSW